MQQRDLSAFDLRTEHTSAVSSADRELMHRLFDTNYRQANHPYLDKALGALHYAAIAVDTETGTPAGFALGDVRVLDLPRLPKTTVTMAGICCIDPGFRRRGLFVTLEQMAMSAAGIKGEGRMLSVGRMAHPASMRTMAQNDSVVPKPGTPITAWQREVGRAIADAYGSADFDDEHFVVIGSGTPIGYPMMEIDVAPEEWIVFEHVNRDRGDSLLGLCWRPDGPPGWNDPA